MPYSFDWPRFEARPLVGILRGFELSLTLEVAKAAADGGLTTLEVTMNTEGVEEQIAALVEAEGHRMNIGAGTVTTMAEYARARDAGACFIVTPVVVPEVIAAAKADGLPVMPGAFTPTEVFQAWQAGADLVKLFPAGFLGPGYVKELKAPLNQVKLLITGGVRFDNIDEYLDLGVEGFGIGGSLFNRARMEARDWPWLSEQLATFRSIFAARR
ncbi:MAG: bifunctional 4-hydroxy-2-oxoglutarate aldolase/2-dehydro-3-deoxy-phosphogluconate aldolase [Planctomycetota bacterium]|jgi:2-dehydro-3-deoxyphosphogluconate aldolase/(4S)-4-hydroxy-2-oxoglutarate aldolase